MVTSVVEERFADQDICEVGLELEKSRDNEEALIGMDWSPRDEAHGREGSEAVMEIEVDFDPGSEVDLRGIDLGARKGPKDREASPIPIPVEEESGIDLEMITGVHRRGRVLDCPKAREMEAVDLKRDLDCGGQERREEKELESKGMATSPKDPLKTIPRLEMYLKDWSERGEEDAKRSDGIKLVSQEAYLVTIHSVLREIEIRSQRIYDTIREIPELEATGLRKEIEACALLSERGVEALVELVSGTGLEEWFWNGGAEDAMEKQDCSQETSLPHGSSPKERGVFFDWKLYSELLNAVSKPKAVQGSGSGSGSNCI